MPKQRISANDLHDMVNSINANLLEYERICIDASRVNGVRVWRVGSGKAIFREMEDPTYSTTELYYYLRGFLDRESKSGHVNMESVQAPEQAPSAIRYMQGYVSHDNYVHMFRDELAYKVPNKGLEPGTYHMFKIVENSETEYITDMRVMSPFEIQDESSLILREDLQIPDIAGSIKNGIYYPQVDPTFHLSSGQRVFLDYLFSNSRLSPQRAMYVGPPGTGKTTAPEQYAAELGRGVFKVACGVMESNSEWLGVRTVNEHGKVVWLKSAFIEALETPDTVIIMDEINRVPSSVMNSLYNLFDDSGQTWIDAEQKSYVRLAAGVVIFATANIGSSHTGTFMIDSAMSDRFPHKVRMDYLPVDKEIKVLVDRTGINENIARQLVNVASEARSIAADESSDNAIDQPISLRQLLACAGMIAQGMHPVQAANFTIFQDYSVDGGDDSPQAAIKELFQGKFG